MTRTFKYNIRDLWEADPIQAGAQVDFEEREADPSKFSLVPGQKIHPAAEMEDEMAGDGMATPYEGAPMAGPPQPGMPGQPPADEEMQPIQPGMGQGMPGQPPMQEGFEMDNLDFYLDQLLDESVDEITEAPFDWERQGNPYMNYGGFTNQRAPASIAAGGPAAIANWQQQTRAVGGGGGGAGGGGAGGGGGAYAGLGGDLERTTRTQRGGGGNYGGPARAPAGGNYGGGGGRAAAPAFDANVERTQNHLKSLGYELGPSGVDGRMGKYTQSAMDAASKHGYTFSKSGDMQYSTPGPVGTGAGAAAGGAAGGAAAGGAAAGGAAAGGAAAGGASQRTWDAPFGQVAGVKPWAGLPDWVTKGPFSDKPVATGKGTTSPLPSLLTGGPFPNDPVMGVPGAKPPTATAAAAPPAAGSQRTTPDGAASAVSKPLGEPVATAAVPPKNPTGTYMPGQTPPPSSIKNPVGTYMPGQVPPSNAAPPTEMRPQAPEVPMAGKPLGQPAATAAIPPGTRPQGTAEVPPAAVPAPAPAQPPMASVQSQKTTNESVMTWKDYISLFESEKR